MDGPWWRVLTKRGPLEKAMAKQHENPMNNTSRQKDIKVKDELPIVVPNMLLEMSVEIAPERMKRRSQRDNNAQLWM